MKILLNSNCSAINEQRKCNKNRCEKVDCVSRFDWNESHESHNCLLSILSNDKCRPTNHNKYIEKMTSTNLIWIYNWKTNDWYANLSNFFTLFFHLTWKKNAWHFSVDNLMRDCRFARCLVAGRSTQSAVTIWREKISHFKRFSFFFFQFQKSWKLAV